MLRYQDSTAFSMHVPQKGVCTAGWTKLSQSASLVQPAVHTPFCRDVRGDRVGAAAAAVFDLSCAVSRALKCLYTG